MILNQSLSLLALSTSLGRCENKIRESRAVQAIQSFLKGLMIFKPAITEKITQFAVQLHRLHCFRKLKLVSLAALGFDPFVSEKLSG